jgi:hypothetical protein
MGVLDDLLYTDKPFMDWMGEAQGHRAGSFIPDSLWISSSNQEQQSKLTGWPVVLAFFMTE